MGLRWDMALSFAPGRPWSAAEWVGTASPGRGLYDCWRRGYGTDVGRPAAATVGGGVHGFPAVLTSFIGRDAAVRDVAGLLGEHRLVTVTGPGGSGKTRLAGQVARRAAAGFADGAWLAELAPVRDPARILAAVPVTLGIREQPGVPAAEVLRQASQVPSRVKLGGHDLAFSATFCCVRNPRQPGRCSSPPGPPAESGRPHTSRPLPYVSWPADVTLGAEPVRLFAMRSRLACG